MRVVDRACHALPVFPGPGRVAEDTPHLAASVNAMRHDETTGARLAVLRQQLHGLHVNFIAHVLRTDGMMARAAIFRVADRARVARQGRHIAGTSLLWS